MFGLPAVGSLCVRMAEEVLSYVVSGKISPDDLIAWLTTDHMVILANTNLILVVIIRSL
jgi:hypothetical protein